MTSEDYFTADYCTVIFIQKIILVLILVLVHEKRIRVTPLVSSLASYTLSNSLLSIGQVVSGTHAEQTSRHSYTNLLVPRRFVL